MTSHAKLLSHKIIMSGFESVMEPSIFMGKMLAIVKSKPEFIFHISES